MVGHKRGYLVDTKILAVLGGLDLVRGRAAVYAASPHRRPVGTKKAASIGNAAFLTCWAEREIRFSEPNRLIRFDIVSIRPELGPLRCTGVLDHKQAASF
jgi:hypothetical protein